MARTKRKWKRTGGVPAREEIAEAQAAIVATLPNIGNRPPTETCWGCGDETRPERAHIEAKINGGSTEPENFLLLCGVCHDAQPDGAPLEYQLEWLRARESRDVRLDRHARIYMEPLEAEADRLGARTLLEEGFGACLQFCGGIGNVFRVADGRAARANVDGIRANRIALLLRIFRTYVQGWQWADGPKGAPPPKEWGWDAA